MSYGCWFVTVKALYPLVIPVLRGNASMQQTLDYIPGPTFRGALAYGLAQANRQAGGNEQDVFKRFDDPGVAVTALLPKSPGDDPCGIPVPLSARVCKLDASHDCKDFLLISGTEVQRCGYEHPQGKYCDGTLESPVYQFMETRDYVVFSPLTIASTHVGIDDKSGSAEENVLFSIERIEAGQEFAGGVSFGSPEEEAFCYQLVEAQQQRAAGEWILGLGQGPGRGRGLCRVSIERLERRKDLITVLNGGELNDRLFGVNGWKDEEDFKNAPRVQVPLTLLSDAILLGDCLTYQTGLGPEDLKKALGIEVGVRLKGAFTRPVTLGGWNKEHGRPKAQEPGVAMGSTFLFELHCNGTDKETILEALGRLEEEGIGIRRQEGYGRVIVAHPFHTGTDHRWTPEFAAVPTVRWPGRVDPQDVMAALFSCVPRTAWKLMDQDFPTESESHCRFLRKNAKESELWVQDASRIGLEIDLANRTRRLNAGSRELHNIKVPGDAGWSEESVAPHRWLAERLSRKWGCYVLGEAANLVQEELRKKIPGAAVTLIQDPDAGDRLEIHWGDEPETVPLGNEEYRQAVRAYFFALRTRARVLARKPATQANRNAD